MAATSAAGGVKQENKFGGASGAGASGAGASGAAGPDVAEDAEDDDAVVNAKPVLGMPNEADEVCGLCGDVPDEPMRTGCMHWFCRECLLGALPERASAANCPTCQRPVNAASLLALAPAPSSDAGGDEGDDAPTPAPAPVPTKAKPKPKATAKGRARRGRADDSDDNTSEEAYQPHDAGAGAAAHAASARPRRAAAAKARAAAAEAKKAEAAAGSDDGDEDGDDEADDGSAGGAPPNLAAPTAAASKCKGKAKATAAGDPIALRSESKLLVLLKTLKVPALRRIFALRPNRALTHSSCRRFARRTSRPRCSFSARRVAACVSLLVKAVHGLMRAPCTDCLALHLTLRSLTPRSRCVAISCCCPSRAFCTLTLFLRLCRRVRSNSG
jgi:hypothetical protein